ncbi:AraC family transcriptional regulator [Gallaecimonas kandeliae]|uniref:AraC family transcriptional regulator n=1 Tax=Gallaecimonas kandeliae TaxID=3029055 RepID=UPI002648C9E2|nr:AraC family transcriptional regulator [Gallaecimonas kandeliae]WKE64194.1 AraC family transcriptional regulator [Gallaecimonas kandeliae]
MVELMKPLMVGAQSSMAAMPVAALPEVVLFSCHQQMPRAPLIYQPSLILIAQGHKVGYLGDREIHYGPGNYLVQTLPLPFECETFASPQLPLLGLSVRIDPVMLAELVGESGPVQDLGSPSPMASVAMTPAMEGAAIRLLECLQDERDVRVLGKGRVRELIYQALKGEQGPALRALVQGQGHYARIVQVLTLMNNKLDEEFKVEQLAGQANMSLSSFHQHFKDVTQSSPLQYLKRLRLLKAQLLLSQDSLNVGQTAAAVGYGSVNQFSRDYKRYFGTSPNNERRSA